MIYLSIDRYDIQYAVRGLAQVLNAPKVLDMMKLRHLVKYLIGTKEYCWLFYFQEEPRYVEGFSDSDWAEDKETRKSVSSGFLRSGVGALVRRPAARGALLRGGGVLRRGECRGPWAVLPVPPR